jgi:uncharacterized protein YceK
MRRTRILVWSLCAALVSSCATVRTLTEYRPGDPVFMSGTRLDVAAIVNDKVVLKRVHARPPAWPWLDLPFSFVADLFFWMLPRMPAAPGALAQRGAVAMCSRDAALLAHEVDDDQRAGVFLWPRAFSCRAG